MFVRNAVAIFTTRTAFNYVRRQQDPATYTHPRTAPEFASCKTGAHLLHESPNSATDASAARHAFSLTHALLPPQATSMASTPSASARSSLMTWYLAAMGSTSTTVAMKCLKGAHVSTSGMRLMASVARRHERIMSSLRSTWMSAVGHQ